MKEVERMELAADWLQRLQSSPQDEALLKGWLQLGGFAGQAIERSERWRRTSPSKTSRPYPTVQRSISLRTLASSRIIRSCNDLSTSTPVRPSSKLKKIRDDPLSCRRVPCVSLPWVPRSAFGERSIAPSLP